MTSIEDLVYFTAGEGGSDLSKLRQLIFGAGQVGGMWIPSISPAMISENVIGSGVQTLYDLSGNANTATQGTPVNRPLWGRVPKSGRRNILTQTATLSTQTKTTTNVQHTLSFRGTGDIELSGTHADTIVGTGENDIVSLTFTPTAGSLTLTVAGDVYDAQLEIGASRSTYQLVADANGYDITEAGSANCYYLQADGTNDAMSTSSINFSTVNKLTVFAMVTRGLASPTGVFCELSSNVNSFSGGFLFALPDGSNQVSFTIRNTAYSQSIFTDSGAPTTTLLTIQADLSRSSEEVFSIRKNGIAQTLSTPLNGNNSGNFGNHQLYLFSRGGTTIPFNGRCFGLIVAGREMTESSIQQVETILNKYTPV